MGAPRNKAPEFLREARIREGKKSSKEGIRSKKVTFQENQDDIWLDIPDVVMSEAPNTPPKQNEKQTKSP